MVLSCFELRFVRPPGLTQPEKRQELEWTAQQRKQAELSDKSERKKVSAMETNMKPDVDQQPSNDELGLVIG